ncbi:MAG: glutamate mutase L [Candidatus Cloacimonadaceae bacterium]|jgi:uncharacterized protein (TIGR01319 family)|nr:glutamate mutase L [Candidatus Cloacimonadota bacterium]
MTQYDYTVITDIGSTTTKAIVIDCSQRKLLALEHADTTVEAPYNDVKIGIINAIKSIERQSGISLITDIKPDNSFSPAPGVRYLSTSSAGGGLQILVIGLTLFDSASSAQRAAYGAGGIILDVFAINDNRSPIEQMLAMRNLRPDMILISGGTDGGAISSVLRLAEILRIAKPMPKFSTSVKIPTIYAGNCDAADMIRMMISQDFDLHILPNLRPSLKQENLKPSRDKIQELFMETVMERAPGYSEIKDIVQAQILPTPVGVLQTLTKLNSAKAENLILFDIGGATTDVFTRINSHFQRTVSANLGMSYSALNVMKESEIETLRGLLPQSISEDELRNYIGNKTIYPTLNPNSVNEYRIEHALAKCALKLALEQHEEMHFIKEKLGFLDALKSNGKDKYEAKFHYISNEEAYYFYASDIDLIIGAGGVFAHAQNTNQCLDILITGILPLGITELAIDKHFITPHLGVLSTVEEDLSRDLLFSDCLSGLAMYIRPIFPEKLKIPVLSVEYDTKTQVLLSDDLLFIPAQKGRKLVLKAMKKCMIDGEHKERSITSDLPIILDSRFIRDRYDKRMDQLLNLYPTGDSPQVFRNPAEPEAKEYSYDVELPYNGDILKQSGDRVMPNEIVARNLYNPPRLFVVNTNSANARIPETVLQSAIRVRTGDDIHFSEELREALPDYGLRQPHYSPVRGRVEFIDFKSGLIVLSEIQKYSSKPVDINIGDKLGIAPKKARRYLTKHIGEFVYEGDSVARYMKTNQVRIASSPSTGQVVDFNPQTGVMTIQYNSKPTNYHAHVSGVVSKVEQDRAIRIMYRAKRLSAAIGWGSPIHGSLIWMAEFSPKPIPEDSIVALGFKPDITCLKQLASQAAGIICPSIDEADLCNYLNTEQGVINTGGEHIPASLVLVHGFGDIALLPHQERYFKDNTNKYCMLEPHTRIRAGVVRAGINILE